MHEFAERTARKLELAPDLGVNIAKLLRSPPRRSQTHHEAAWREQFTKRNSHMQAELDAEAAQRAAQLQSPDVLVSDIARWLHSETPGELLYLGRIVLTPRQKSLHLTDLDIETRHAIVQVKAGRERSLERQLQRTLGVSDKVAIGFAPTLAPSASNGWRDGARALRAQGYLVVHSAAALLFLLRQCAGIPGSGTQRR